MSWVLDHSPAQRGDRLVLISLANHADRDGANAFPTVPTIARESGALSERSVQYALHSLEHGHEGSGRAIERQGSAPTGATIWRVLMDDQATTFRGIPASQRGALSAPPEGCSSDAESAPLGVQNATALNARGPSGEPSFNRQELPPTPHAEAGDAPLGPDLTAMPSSARRRERDLAAEQRRDELEQWVSEHPATAQLQQALVPILNRARDLIDAGTFAIWLDPLHAHQITDAGVVVGTQPDLKAWTTERFGGMLATLAGRPVRVLGCGCPDIGQPAVAVA